jgi:hypothetical protein
MFNRTVSIQAQQIEDLETAIDEALEVNESYTVYNATFGRTQATFETLYDGLSGKNLPIPPETKFYWWDGTQIRGIFGTLYDYFLPILSSRGSLTHDTTNNIHENALQKIIWYSRQRLLVLAQWYTSTAGVFSTYSRLSNLDNALTTWDGSTLQRVVFYNHVLGQWLYYNTADGTLRLKVDPVTTHSLGPISASPTIGVIADNGDTYYQDNTTPTSVKRRTAAGVITTVVTGFTGLYHLLYDNVNNKLILFSHTPPATTSSASKADPDGSNLTTLVASNTYAAGANVSNFHYMGASVRGGYLYVPVPGNKYVNTHLKYNIATGTSTTEVFDFGLAKPILEGIKAEAQTYVNNAGGFQGSQQAQYWGSQYYAFPLERLLNFERDPDDTAWLVVYETGQNSPLPGAAAGLAWAIVPDDGCSQKIYPLIESTNRRADCITVAQQVYDTAVKEMNLSWTAIDDEYQNYVIEFDNGLVSATETIRVQFNGDTGANYDYSFWRMAVATPNNGTAAGQTYIDLYGISSGGTAGGRYILTLTNVSSTATGEQGVLIEGFTSTGAVTTGSINSILGEAKWNRTVAGSLVSVRVFLSGVTASFPAGATIRVMAYRTQMPNLIGSGVEY